MVEIELNESLRRRRDELRAKVDAIGTGTATAGVDASGADLESRRRELRTLGASIEEMQKKLRGAYARHHS